jgi:DNA-binding response OmpR family regulator
VNQAHYVRVYLVQLRQKIEVDSARPRLLLTEPGIGYRLRSDYRRPVIPSEARDLSPGSDP